MEKNVLIVPMQPTPNGRMHIGHGAGTYLRSDILGRALRVRGYSVSIISGSDAFENWIIAESQRIGKSPDETCKYYHEAIKEDLNNLDIQMDAWIDPKSEEDFKEYLSLHETLLKHLIENGNATLENELIPYSKESGQAMLGAWISGKCPNCNQVCQGSSCVYCGSHFQPEEIIEPKSRLDNSQLEWRMNQNWFIRPVDPLKIIDALENRGLKSVWKQAVEDYLNKSGRIRLSGPGTWGLESELVPKGFVLSNPYYLYSVYCGEIYKKMNKNSQNPFHPDSKVTVIGVFGSDNSTPGLVAPHVISQGAEKWLKPFDITIVNGMLFFEGQKCSTSKRHGIWLEEIRESNTGITSDELRFFLAQASLDESNDDISLDDMINTINMYREWYKEKLIPAIKLVSNSKYIIKYNNLLERAISKQTHWLEPNKFDTTEIVEELKNWMYDDTIEKGTWILGLALLGLPITPKLSRLLFQYMGLEEPVTISEIENIEIIPLDLPLDIFSINSNDLSLNVLKPYIHLSEVEA